MAGTVIDSLVLEFGLDQSKFTQGQREAMGQLRNFELAALKTGNELERQQTRLNDIFSTFRREAVGALSLFLGGRGIKEFVSYLTNLDATTGRLARVMNMSTAELSAWQGAAKQAGGTAEGVSATLAAMTQDMNMLSLTGQSTMSSVLRPFVNLFDQNGGFKNATEILLELADLAERMNDPARFAAIFNMIPGATPDTLNLLLNGRRSLEEILRVQRQIGGTTDASARAAQAYQAALANLDRASTSLGRTLVTIVEPALTRVFNSLQRNLTEGIDAHAGKGSLAEWLFKRYDTFGDMWSGFKDALGYDPNLAEAKRELAKGLTARAASGAGPGAPTNWSNFLIGLSYLETDQRNVGNTTSSARGYFQFLTGTANKAVGAGLPDPREGGYREQADATRRYIERFYPKAAEAIQRGDYQAAETMLRGEWPSLPGGSQQQNASRYGRYRDILAGGGGGGNNTSTVNINTMNINGAQDPQKTGDAVLNRLREQNLAVPFNGSSN